VVEEGQVEMVLLPQEEMGVQELQLQFLVLQLLMEVEAVVVVVVLDTVVVLMQMDLVDLEAAV
jgi:hypothetical protein